MWRSEDEEQTDGWTTYGSGTEGCWSKSPRRGWTDSAKFGERFYTKEVKAAAVARRGTERALATVATMATREKVQEALQQPQARCEGEETTPVRKNRGGARS